MLRLNAFEIARHLIERFIPADALPTSGGAADRLLQTIFTPLTLMVSNISSASGRVTIANAGNGKTGVGATWDYSALVGTDNMFTGGEISLSRNLKFNNPNNEPFTVTFSVVGVLASGGTGGGGGSGTNSSNGSTTTTSTSSTTGTLMNALLSVTYNPLMNTVTWQVMKQ